MPENVQVQDPTAIDSEAVDGEIVEAAESADLVSSGPAKAVSTSRAVSEEGLSLRYIFLPIVFLTSALLGGLRINASDGAFVFFKPPLLCLVLATVLMFLFIRGHLLRVEGWLSESFGPAKNIANASILISLFAASAQLFNSLLPESGLPFWVVGFCFVWALWNNLFFEFDPRRTIRSLAALFGLAFVVKYLLLANLTAPAGSNWLRSVIENPGKEALTWLLDLPRFSAATGYIQFFTMILFFCGLYFLPASTFHERNRDPAESPSR